jgi:hypothetical protein
MTWVHATCLAMNAFTYLDLDFLGFGSRRVRPGGVYGPIRDNLIAAVGILLRSLPIQLQFGA